jgi:hypothetical protein
MKGILLIMSGGLVVIAVLLTAILGNRVTPVMNGEQPKVEELMRVDPCTLSNNPAKYNHKLVEVSGYFSHSFENFSLVVPCKGDASVWIEYGGLRGSNTMICCDVPAEEQRPKNLEVEGISVPLLNDENFKGFNAIINKEYDTIIKATVIGRYFSGEPFKGADGKIRWTGFGHFGMNSLLAIQQVKSFEPHDRFDIDYRDTFAGNDTPENADHWFNTLAYWTENENDSLDYQKIAADAEANSNRNNPAEVAKNYLAKTLGINKSLLSEPRKIQTLRGAIVYEWTLSKTRGFRVTVGHPYVLLPYLKDPANFPWIGVAAFNKADNNGKTTVADISKPNGKKTIRKNKRNR